MKTLKVEVKTKFRDYTSTIYYKDYGMDIIISFKEKGKFFKTKINKEILFDKCDKESIEAAITFLTDKNIRENIVFDYIKEYFEIKRQVTIDKKDIELVKELTSLNHSFNIEVEVEDYE